ncbi:MAG: glycosyltransferase [Winogradskyella sp.]
MNVAIFTPNKNPYSETFIQAHKLFLKDKVYYYYGRGNNIKLEGERPLKAFTDKLVKKMVSKEAPVWVRAVKRSLIKNKIDVILVEYGTHAYHLLPLLKTINIPFSVHFHGYDASVHNVIEKCDQYKDVFDIASKVFVVSTVMEEKLIEIGCPRDILVNNTYGPNPKFDKVVPSFSKKQFIAVGRFTNKKAPYYTIFAFNKVLKKHPDAKLVMAGDGELLNSCKNIVRYLGISENVDFVGVISSDQYVSYLENSLAFVQHSITGENGDKEGTPLSILEASSAGLPVVSTFHAGIPDVIEHDKTGLLVQEHDVEKMGSYMIELLNNKNYAIDIGRAGKRHVRENFSMERHISKLQKVLEEL